MSRNENRNEDKNENDNKGFVTIPTDAGYAEETKKYIEEWGADAVRDCDGVSLPKDLKQFGCEVYKSYFIVREDGEYARAHKEYLQNVALTTSRKLAVGDTLEIDLLDGIFKESLEVNTEDYKTFWQVIDRTTGRIHTEWEYAGANIVKISGCEKFHEYSVNFFARSIWDPVQIYNYYSNGWTCEKDMDIDPVYPEALAHMLYRMEEWLKSNPDVTVVRFTTFFYNFLIIYETGLKQKIWDWHNYAMTASPAMFRLFEKETGVKITLEDIIDGGTYSNRFVIPNAAMQKYKDFVQKKCAEWAESFVNLCHKYGKKAMMFDGDHRIGVEPYSPYFKDIGLDAVVGAPSSSVYIRQISDIKGIKYTEGRLNPYFFPNECAGDDKGTEILTWFWNGMKRGLLRKPIDRIGFGGYLKQIENYEKLKRKIKSVCDEFRAIKRGVDRAGCAVKTRAAVLTYGGKADSWMMNGIFVDDTRQGGYYYNSVIFALSVLPTDVDFISFEELKTLDLSVYDAIISCGVTGTSFHGDKCWKDEKVVSKIREYVYSGGGYFGVGEPSGYFYQGRYFQLSDVLGLEKECDFTHFERRDRVRLQEKHWITEGIDLNKIRFNEKICGVYPRGATLLAAHFEPEYPLGAQNACNADFAVNEYGKGRSVYFSGISNDNEAYRLVYKALLWTAHKEAEYRKTICENPQADAFYYPEKKNYALYNNTNEKLETVFYDRNGAPHNVILGKEELRFVHETEL